MSHTMKMASTHNYVDCRGRVWQLPTMEEPITERMVTPMPRSLIEKVDDYRFANRVTSRSEAVRQLLKLGIQSAKAASAEKAAAS